MEWLGDWPGHVRGSAGKVALRNGYAFVACDSGGLQVLDVHIPAKPVFVAVQDTLRQAWDVTLDGDFAYVANGTNGLVVINIADPDHPTIVGTCATPGPARSLVLSNGYA
ncbi:MAG: hypothetical protein V9H26_02105 [Verrucomicrobiota bacterium]